MIKNVVFDLGNVILKDKPNAILDSLGLNQQESESVNKVFFGDWEELDLGKINLQQHLEKCKFGFLLKKETAEKLLNYYKYRPFNQEIIRIIKQLKTNGYKVFILSNNNIDVKNYLMNLPFIQNFDGEVYSCDYQILKPNLEIYKILFEKYNLLPEKCYFVDDRKQNVEAGEKLGMKCFVFNDKENGIAGL